MEPSNFNSKSMGKPTPWNREDNAEFQTWSERPVSYMGIAGDKIWKSILKYIQDIGEDDGLETKE